MRPVRYPVAAIQNHKERTPNKVRMVSHEERHNKRMFTIIIRVAVILVTLILIMRLMGKKTLGEMQPFEFVITLVLSDLACSPMSDPQSALVRHRTHCRGLFAALPVLAPVTQKFLVP